MHHELPINPMQNSLQAIPFPRILRIKQLKQSGNNRVINILFCHLCIEAWGRDKLKQQFIHKLQMWPSRIKHRLIIIILTTTTCPIIWRKNSKQINSTHSTHSKDSRLTKPHCPTSHKINKLNQSLCKSTTTR